MGVRFPEGVGGYSSCREVQRLGATKITDLGVPGTLRGVPFFANAFSDQLQFILASQKHGTAYPFRHSSQSETLVWDGSDERLRCVESRQAVEK
jgi:hypothetical protein